MRFAHIFLAFWTAAAALAGPPLTTIQDTLYRADGTRFNGILQIQWTSFEASDQSQIAMQNLTVRIVLGALYVKLVPTTDATPPARYSVKYISDGRVQFQETWAVSPSALPLRVRDVRVTSPPPSVPDTILQSDVEGLPAELSSRPVKGAAYAPGRTAVINDAGALEAATGSLSDCVRVDGSSGPCGHTPGFVDAEVPSGIVDGGNPVFALAYAPAPLASLELFRNGIRLKADFDYVLSGNTVQFLPGAVPQAGDTILSSYRVDGGGAAATFVSVATPEVLCSAQGGANSLGTMDLLGSCQLPNLVSGDRIEAKFDYTGAPGYTIEVIWNGQTLASGENVASGRAEIARHADGARWSSLVWTNAAVAAGAGAVAVDSGRLEFRGSGDAQLRGYTVIKYPARAH
jgi:hypothetical protein